MPIAEPLFEFYKRASLLRYRTCSVPDVTKAISSAVYFSTDHPLQALNLEGMALTEPIISEMVSVYVALDDDADVKAGHVDYLTYTGLGAQLYHLKENMGYSVLLAGPDAIVPRVWIGTAWRLYPTQMPRLGWRQGCLQTTLQQFCNKKEPRACSTNSKFHEWGTQ